MKKKFLGKLLTMLLVVSMVLTLLPTSALAAWGSWDGWYWSGWSDFLNWGSGAQDDAQDDAQDNGLAGLTADGAATYATDNYYRIVHLDCGRKYFSVQQIETIIDAMYLNGFNQLQLAFGNGGLRLILDDMTLKDEDGNQLYSSGDVISAIQDGNDKYDATYNYTPGEKEELTESEMNAIISYANARGIEIVPLLNLPGHMDAILSSDKFSSYKLASEPKYPYSLDLNNENAVAFGKALLRRYVEYFASEGCKYFNFGADEYGNSLYNPYFTWGQRTVSYDSFKNFMDSCADIITRTVTSVAGSDNVKLTARCFNDFVRFNGNSGVNTGIEVCYWSNQWANSEYQTAATLANDYKLINTNQNWYYVPGSTDYSYEKALKGINTYKTTQFRNIGNDGATISDNANVGAMFCVWCDNPAATLEVEKITNLIAAMAEANGFPKIQALTVSDSLSGTTTTTGTTKDGSANISIAENKSTTLTANKPVTWTCDNDQVIALSAAGAVAAQAQTNEITAESVILTPIGIGSANITAKTTESETITFNVTVTEAQYTTKEVWLSVGGNSETFEQSGSYSATGGDAGIATATVTSDTETGGTQKTRGSVISEISGSATGVLYADNGYYLTVGSNGNIGATQDINAATTVTVESKTSWESTYYTIQADGYYLGIKSQQFSWYTIYTLTTAASIPNGQDRDGYYWTLGTGDDYSISDYCLNYNNGWTVTYQGWDHAAKLYSVTETTLPGGAVTKVSFTGVAVGDTEYIVGDTKYIVHVRNIPAGAANLYVDFWVTSTPVTPNNITTTDSGSGTARRVYATYNPAEFNVEDGVLLSGTMPQTGKYTAAGSQGVFPVSYWKTRYLPKDVRQTADGWTNKNGVGTDTKTEDAGGKDIEYIRYWENKWQYRAVNSTGWIDFTTSADAAGNQIAAYYLIRTDITKEVTTSVTDWTDDQEYQCYGVALDFCVKYPSQNTKVPSTFKNTHTQWFNCDGAEGNLAYQNGYTVIASETNVGSWKGARTVSSSTNDYYRVINYINVTEDKNYEVYMITATPSASFTLGNISCPDTINYTGEETVLWAESESVAKDSGLEKHSDYECGGDPVIKRVMIQQCSGMLLTYYVKPKEAANPLTVHFRMQGSEKDFASYQIVPKTAGTKFASNIALPTDNDGIGELTNAKIENDQGVLQTVTSDLKNVPIVPAQYRNTDYKCFDLKTSADLTEIYLYYTFDNSATFVIDFGLPLTITPTEVNDKLANAKIISAAATTTDKVTVNTENPESIVITPTQAFVREKEAVTFTLTYKGQRGNNDPDTTSYLITILPASNVLYEENFLTQGKEQSTGSVTRYGWTESKFDANKVQQTQKLDEAQRFGYDAAYQDVTAAAGYWTATGLKSSSDGTKSLTTSFYGNAIDVIGSCGPNTGRVMITIKNAADKAIKSVLVHTTYNGSGTIGQVPLAHIVLGGEDANYTAIIRGYAPAETSTQSASSPLRTYGLYSASYDALAADLAAEGLTMNDVEVVSASEAAASAASAQSAVQTYAAASSIAVYDGESSVSSDNTVTIDGFRVYRSTSNDAYKSLGNEYNVTYMNILDAVKSMITAFVDTNDKEATISVTEYEAAGGPQNEIYLLGGGNRFVQFMLLDSSGQAMVNTPIQVSLRAVSGSTTSNVTGTDTLESTTEMYYTVKSNEKGIVTITNTGSGMLAIGNVKLPAGATTKAPDEVETQLLLFAARAALNAAPVDPEPEQPAVFTPEHLDASVSTIRFFRNKLVTLTVSASADVAKLTVNGRELRPTNGWLVRMGWSDTYTYVLTDTVKKNDSKTYEIVAFDAGGVSSAAKTVSAD